MWGSLGNDRVAISLVVAGAVLLAFVGRIAIASRIAAPQLLCDEFVYADVARSIADHGEPLLRGVSSRQNLLYPAAIAPGWLFGSVGTAYAIAKAINVAAMTMAAVLTYVWSRRLVSPLLGLAVTLLVLAMPWFEYTGLLMTENLFFPLFVGATFAAAHALERPTVARQVLVLALVAVAYGTRTQGLVLLPIVAAAVIVYALLEAAAAGGLSLRRIGVVLRPWLVSAALLAAAGVLYVGWVEIRGKALSTALGDYSVILDWHRTAGDVVHWAWMNVAAVTVTSGIVPLAGAVALAVGVALRPGAFTPAERALAAAVAAALVWMAVQVGIFATQVTSVVERYLFYVEPLLFLALVTWLSRARPRRLVAGTVGAVVALVLVLVVPTSDYASSILPNNVGLYGLYDLTIRVHGGVGRVETLLQVVAVAGLAAFVLLPRRIALVAIVGALGVWLVVSSYRVHPPMGRQAAGAAAFLGSHKSWIDDIVGRDADVTYVYSAQPAAAFDATRFALETEFWNRSVRSVTAIEGTELCGLPEHAARLAPARAGLAAVPSPRATFVAQLSSTLVPVGALVGTSALESLYRPAKPLRFQAFTSAISADRWTGGRSLYVQLGRRPGVLSATLSRPGSNVPDAPSAVTLTAAPATVSGLTVTATGPPYWRRRWTVHPLAARTFRVPIRGAPTAVTISVDPTFSPAAFGLPDTRNLGVQASFRFRPSAAGQ